MDDISGLESIETFSFAQVPQHCDGVFPARCTERSIRGDSDAVEVTAVSGEVADELAVHEFPHLNDVIPPAGNDQFVLGDALGTIWRREANAGDPVSVAILDDVVLAHSQGIPKLDGLVTGSGDDLTIVLGEGNGENVLGVSKEPASGISGVKVPKAESSVPGSREGKESIRRDLNVLT